MCACVCVCVCKHCVRLRARARVCVCVGVLIFVDEQAYGGRLCLRQVFFGHRKLSVREIAPCGDDRTDG